MDVIPVPSTRMPRFIDLKIDVGRIWLDPEPYEVPGVTEVHRPDLVDPVPIATAVFFLVATFGVNSPIHFGWAGAFLVVVSLLVDRA